jgi:hypothetical protein
MEFARALKTANPAIGQRSIPRRRTPSMLAPPEEGWHDTGDIVAIDRAL